jgi:hypothetical protein
MEVEQNERGLTAIIEIVAKHKAEEAWRPALGDHEDNSHIVRNKSMPTPFAAHPTQPNRKVVPFGIAAGDLCRRWAPYPIRSFWRRPGATGTPRAW